ncbi:MAG: beta-galactosidase [Candidatus Methylumidiphilus sp.]
MNLKFTTLILFVFLMFSQQALSQEYKLGVVMFRPDNPEYELDRIVFEIAGNDVYREGNGSTLQLVVQTEIPWKDTNPSEGVYDFSKFIEYAKTMKARGIKWTPLFSPHYPPQWAIDKYFNNQLTDKHGNKTGGFHLPFSPSSTVWKNDVPKWINTAL